MYEDNMQIVTVGVSDWIVKEEDGQYFKPPRGRIWSVAAWHPTRCSNGRSRLELSKLITPPPRFGTPPSGGLELGVPRSHNIAPHQNLMLRRTATRARRGNIVLSVQRQPQIAAEQQSPTL